MYQNIELYYYVASVERMTKDLPVFGLVLYVPRSNSCQVIFKFSLFMTWKYVMYLITSITLYSSISHYVQSPIHKTSK